MCFAIPGRITEVWTEPNGATFAYAEFAGEVKRIGLAFLPDLQVGDYTIVHAGMALSKVPPEQVEEVTASMMAAGILDDDGMLIEGGALL